MLRKFCSLGHDKEGFGNIGSVNQDENGRGLVSQPEPGHYQNRQRLGSTEARDGWA